MPSKGDKVKVVIEGEYSHQGGRIPQRTTASGWHVVKVGPNDVAVPPDAEIEVTKKWVPAEPLVGVVVHNRKTGNWWRNTGASNPYRWRQIPVLGGIYASDPDMERQRIGLWPFIATSWLDLLARSENGHRLEVYVPAELLT